MLKNKMHCGRPLGAKLAFAEHETSVQAQIPLDLIQSKVDYYMPNTTLSESKIMQIIGPLEFNDVMSVLLDVRPSPGTNHVLKFHMVGGIGMPPSQSSPWGPRVLAMRIVNYRGQYANHVIASGPGDARSLENEADGFHLGRTERIAFPFFNIEATVAREAKSGCAILCGLATYGYEKGDIVNFQLHGMTSEPVGKIEELEFVIRDRVMWGQAAAIGIY